MHPVFSGALVPAAAAYGAAASYRMFHPPRRRHHRTPADFGLAAEEVAVRVPGSRVRLRGWLMSGCDDRLAVVGHGIGLTRSASLAHAALLVRRGYTVCLFDHRNHGESDGDRAPHRLSARFTADFAAMVGHLRRGARADAWTLVWGFSFSSYASFFVLGMPDCGVDAVVCDSGPTLVLRDLLANFVAVGGLPVPRPLRDGAAGRALGATCSRLGVAALGVGATWPPEPVGRFADTPMLFLTGDADPITRTADVLRFAARYPRAHTTVLPGAGHLDGHKIDPAGYAERIHEFLAAVEPRRGPAPSTPSTRSETCRPPSNEPRPSTTSANSTVAGSTPARNRSGRP